MLLCSTPRGITGKIAGKLTSNILQLPSAQRLAASQEKSHIDGLRWAFYAQCAQRLAASQEKSRFRVYPLSAQGPLVLNASRHHRKNRTDPSGTIDQGGMCSTPRGITGKIAAH